MPVTTPPTQASLGNRVVAIATVPAAIAGQPTLAEANAALFGQCHIYGSPEAQPTQNTGASPAKLCRKTEDQRLGRVTFPSFDIQYSIIPQELGTPAAAGNEMYEALVPGTEVVVYFADGLDGEDTSAFVTGDVLNRGFLVEVGEYREGVTGDGEFDEFACTQTLVPIGGRLLHNYVLPAV